MIRPLLKTAAIFVALIAIALLALFGFGAFAKAHADPKPTKCPYFTDGYLVQGGVLHCRGQIFPSDMAGSGTGLLEGRAYTNFGSGVVASPTQQLGVSGSVDGSLKLCGSGSTGGCLNLFSEYLSSFDRNWFFPAAAGTAGQPLVSAGAGAPFGQPQTWAPFPSAHSNQWDISSVVNDGSGHFELVLTEASDLATGEQILVVGAGSANSPANVPWTITVVDSTHIVLQGSSFTSVTPSGALATRFPQTIASWEGAAATEGHAAAATRSGNLTDGGPWLTVPTVAALETLDDSTLPNSAVVARLGYAAPGDVPILIYAHSGSACSLAGGNGDTGSQVKSASGKCWLAALRGPIDVRQFGATYPFFLHVATTGSDTNNYCLDAAHPCATFQHGIDIAAQLDFKGQQNTLSFGSGSFVGGLVSGPWFGGAGDGISGQYLKIVGAGSGLTTLTVPGGAIAVLGVSTQAAVTLAGLTFTVPANAYGLFAQNAGTYVGFPSASDVVFTGAANTSIAQHAEALSQIEFSVGATMTAQGTFEAVFAPGQGGYIEFDPGTAGNHVAISTGTGLTTTQGWVFAQTNAIVWIGNATTFGTQTGPTATLSRGSVLDNESANSTLGAPTLTVTLDASSNYFPLVTPGSLTAGCGAGATITGTDRAGFVTIGTTPGSTCSFNFTIAYPSNSMSCGANNQTSVTRDPTYAAQAGNGVTMAPPTGNFTAGDKIAYRCTPIVSQ